MTRRTRRAGDPDATLLHIPAFGGPPFSGASEPGQPYDDDPTVAMPQAQETGPFDAIRAAGRRAWVIHQERQQAAQRGPDMFPALAPAAIPDFQPTREPEPVPRQPSMAPAGIARPGTLSSLTAAEVEAHMLRIPPPSQVTATASREAVGRITYPPPGSSPERYAAVMCQIAAATDTRSQYEWPAAWSRRAIEAGTDTREWPWKQIKETEAQMRPGKHHRAEAAS